MKRPILLLLAGAALGAFFGWVTALPLLLFAPLILAVLFLSPPAKRRALLFTLVFIVAFRRAEGQRENPFESVDPGFVSTQVLVTESGRKNAHTQNYGAIMEWKDRDIRIQLQIPAEDPPLLPGEMARVSGEFRRPDGTQNDGLFSYADYLLRNGKKGLFRARSVESLGYIENRGYAIKRSFYIGLEKRATALFSPRTATLFQSVLGGGVISPEDADLYRDLGLSHIFAVSGLHIALLFALFMIPLIPLVGKQAARLFALGAVLLFAWMIGFPVSAVRALIMVFVLVLARHFHFPYDPLTALFFAGTLIILLFPGNIFDAGFHLSFAGVWSVVWVRKAFLRRIGRERSPVFSAIAIQAGVFPAILFHFGQAPLVGVLANLLLIPLFSIIIGLGTLAILVWVPLTVPAMLLAKLAETGASVFYILTDAIAALRVPVFRLYWMGPVTAAWLYLMLYVSLRPQNWRAMPLSFRNGILRTLTVTMALGILLVRAQETILFMDVGQGDATLIRTGGKAYMVDTGGEIREDQRDSLESVVLPSLAREGVHTLEAIFITHFDADHIENLQGLAEHIPIATVYAPGGLVETPAAREWEEWLTKRKISLLPLFTGDTLALSSKGMIEVLYDARLGGTNDSFVLRYNNQKTRVLFPGDLEQRAEGALAGDLSANLLKVGHHGSRSSTSQAFLSRIRPDHAVISAGYKNPYGHPHPEVLDRLMQNDISIYRTDDLGNIRIRLHREGYRISGYPSDDSMVAVGLSLAGFLPVAYWSKKASRRTYATYRISEKSA